VPPLEQLFDRYKSCHLFIIPIRRGLHQSPHKELFGTVDKKHRIFQRKETLPRPVVTFPPAEFSRPKQHGARPLPEAEQRDLSKRLERIILQRYRPASLSRRTGTPSISPGGSTIISNSRPAPRTSMW
jgi:hypothetical protein